MKKIVAIALTLCIAALTSTAYSQVVTRLINKAANKAEDKTEERIEDEADKAVEKQVNKAFNKLFGKSDETSDSIDSSDNTPSASGSGGSASSASSRAAKNAYLNALGMSTGTANVKPLYEFDGYIEMTVSEFEKEKEKEKTIYTTYIDSKSFDYGIHFKTPEEEDYSLMIFDTDNNLMVTLSDANGEKTGFAVAFTPEQAEAIAEEAEEDTAEGDAATEDAYKAYKTGKTKNILGYTCEEYLIEDENETVTMWITRDLNKEMKKTYMKNSTFTGLFSYAYYTDGVVMEYIIEDKKDGDKSVMTVTDIDLSKKSSFNTMGYTIMDMSGMMPDEETGTGDAAEESDEE
ncbi:MAG: DUF4412 domain-containing protein [Bacteroidales bacterium]|nr:DUF4412 domain-containing protein [Bacteroidales bacterium]MDT8432392.1 DUF4412 domain-containing protein [Bacteroidales bacterium]